MRIRFIESDKEPTIKLVKVVKAVEEHLPPVTNFEWQALDINIANALIPILAETYPQLNDERSKNRIKGNAFYLLGFCRAGVKARNRILLTNVPFREI